MGKQKSPAREKQAAMWNTSNSSLDSLARYNAECARGIVHTAEWDERMTRLQAAFDADTAQEAQWEAEVYASRRRQRVNLR